MLDQFSYSLPDDLDAELQAQIEIWKHEDRIAKIWAKDATIWTATDESKWLGWLDVIDEELSDPDKYRSFADDIKHAGFKDVLLMGMGGSSLCPEVLAKTFEKANFHILDSTVPAQVKSIEDKLDLTRTLFIVASKSGSTLEPNCFKQYFFDRVSDLVGSDAGKRFVAITDPGSRMEQVARDDGFRRIFYGKPEIGGRFSALSPFGMTAAAVMDIDVKRFLINAKQMSDACKSNDVVDNPGALLGLILGVCQRSGRDKLTIFTSPEIFDLGAWLEQLIAESTGKNGVAIIPVDREPPQPPVSYGLDRLFVYLRSGDSNIEYDKRVKAIAFAGLPFIEIEIPDRYDLGQEFFRWEFATAVAGSVIGINPFNQPDVESAKVEARKLTDEYEKTGHLPAEEPFFEEDGISLFTSEVYSLKLHGMIDKQRLAECLSAHLANLTEGDYFAILAYVEMSDENVHLLESMRSAIIQGHPYPTCLGFGPRFLHSTGQAYKGGPNSGVFLQITSDDEFDLPVPNQKYTFGVVKAAQARGDFQVLLDRGRRALRVHLGRDVVKDLLKLNKLLQLHS